MLLYALSGVDGSGKSTFSAEIVDRLLPRGAPAHCLSALAPLYAATERSRREGAEHRQPFNTEVIQ